jgi:flagellar biosynthetic protein FlhB
MAENENGQERTEAATGKQLNEAREKGQIPRSREFNTAAMMLASAVGLLWLGGRIMIYLQEIMRRSLSQTREELFKPTAMTETLQHLLSDYFLMLGPYFLLLVVVALGAPIAIGGWNFSAAAFGFKFSKLNPVSGLKRIFSWNGVVELLKSMVKFLLVGGVTLLMMRKSLGEIVGLGYESLESALAHSGHLVIGAFITLSVSLLVIAAVDVPFQLWNHARQLRMSKQDVKEESKDLEGRPEVKGRIRSMQREMARRRMMQQVPKADVIVTNPTHYAVALRYHQDQMGAPRVVAKGADLLAARIRAVAGEHQIPVLEAPPLARALFFNTELDQEIPAGLYLAVAQVLAYVYQLKTARRHGGIEPQAPSDLPIPDELQHP